MKQENQDLNVCLSEGGHQKADEIIEKCLGERLEEEEVKEAVNEILHSVLRLVLVVYG